MSSWGERKGKGRGSEIGRKSYNNNYRSNFDSSTYNENEENKYRKEDIHSHDYTSTNLRGNIQVKNQKDNESSKNEYDNASNQRKGSVRYESQENFLKKTSPIATQINSADVATMRQREYESEEPTRNESYTLIDKPTPAPRNSKVITKENVTSNKIQLKKEKEKESTTDNGETKGAKQKSKSVNNKNTSSISLCINCVKAVAVQNHPKGHRVLPFNDGLQELKDKEINSLETAVGGTENLLKSEMYISDMVCLWKDCIHESLENVFKNFEKSSSENIDRLVKLTGEGNKVVSCAKSTGFTTLMDLINLQTSSKPVILEGLQISSSLQSKPDWLVFNWFKLSLGLFISSGKEIFAISKTNTTQFARFGLQGDRLLLHSLCTKTPDKDSVFIPFDAVNSLFEREDFHAFMRISYNGKDEGFLFMRLNKETFWGRQFVSLCTGEDGPSLRNTRFFRSCWKGRPGHHVWGGDYSRNNGSGGQSFIKSNSPLVWYPQPISQGLIAARPGYQDRSSIFRIYLHGEDLKQSKSDAVPLVDNYSFGNVIDGLDSLSHVADLPNISRSKIEDTGRFLTLT